MSKITSKNQPRHKGKYCKVPDGYLRDSDVVALKKAWDTYATQRYSCGWSDGIGSLTSTHFHYGYIILAFVLGMIFSWSGLHIFH